MASPFRDESLIRRLPRLWRDLVSLELGGSADTVALAALGGAMLLSNPAFSQVPLAAPGLLAAAGGARLAWRSMEQLRREHLFRSALEVRSSEAPLPAERGRSLSDALLLGYTTDRGRPVWVDYESLMQHLFIVGQSGVGKTVAGTLLMAQHINNGGGLLFIDGKRNIEDLEQIHRFCVWAGREHDLRIIDAGDPDRSNTYNPILDGDPDEVSARVLSLIPSTENNPGADHYKQSANQGVATLVAALKRAGLAYNFIDLTILLMSQPALEYLERVVPPSPEATNYRIFISQFRGKDGKIDLTKLKGVFGGIAGRLYMFGSGNFGRICNTYTPEISLYDDLIAQRIIYVMLPTLGKDVAANNFGKMIVGDLRTAVSWVQNLPKLERPWPPTLGFFDEAGSYVNMSWNRLFEQSRSAHIALAPAVQTFANLEAISRELYEMVIGNTWTKLFFKLGTQATAEEAAELIGKEVGVMRAMSRTVSESATSQNLRAAPVGGSSEGGGVSYSEREQEVHRVSPDDLKSLDRGECIVTYGGDRLYNLRVPRLEFSEAFMQACPPLRYYHKKPGYRRGINLFQRIDEFLSSESREEIERRVSEK